MNYNCSAYSIVRSVLHFHHSLYSHCSISILHLLPSSIIPSLRFASMAKFLMIDHSFDYDAEQVKLFKPVEAEILKKYEVYISRSVTNTRCLLEKHQFQAVLIITLGTNRDHELVNDQLAQFIESGGTLILRPSCFNFCLRFSRKLLHPTLSTRITLSGFRIDDSMCLYGLNKKFANVFGPSVIASLDDSIYTDTRVVDYIPDNAKIYKNLRATSSECAAAFVKRGEGFIGYLGDIAEESSTQILLLAMLGKPDLWSLQAWQYTNILLDHAIKPYTPPSATEINASLPILPFDKAASPGTPSRMPRLMDANPGCTVCQILVPAKKCGNCRLVQYCSTKCQTADWRSHKAMCISAEEDNASSVTGRWTPATTSDAQYSSADEGIFE